MGGTLFALNVSVVICQDNKFLLVKRAEDEEVFPSYWGIPGGEVETTDASLEAALMRECEEEINVSIEDLSLVSNNIVERNNKVILFVVYKAKLHSGTPEPKDGTEAVEWKDIDKARTLNLTPKTLDILELVSSTTGK